MRRKGARHPDTSARGQAAGAVNTSRNRLRTMRGAVGIIVARCGKKGSRQPCSPSPSHSQSQIRFHGERPISVHYDDANVNCQEERPTILVQARVPSSSLASSILPEPPRPPPPPPPPVVLNRELLLTGVLPCELAAASDAPDWTCRISGAGGTELSLSCELVDDEGSGACTLEARVLLLLTVDRGACACPPEGGGGDMGSTVEARERVVRRDAPRAGVAGGGGGAGSREAVLVMPREDGFATPRAAAVDPPRVEPPLPALSSCSSSSSPSSWPGKAPGGNPTTRTVRSRSTLSSFGG